MANDAYSVASGGTVRAAWPAASGMPTWAAASTPMAWMEIPNSRIDATDYDVHPVTGEPRPLGNTQPTSRGMMESWCGACLRPANDFYLMGAAGGHQDNDGNQVRGINLSLDTIAGWTELAAPTPNAQVYDTPAAYYADLRPAPTHSYWSTQYIPEIDAMVIFGRKGIDSSRTAPPGDWPWVGDSFSKRFDVASSDWLGPTSIAQMPENLTGPVAQLTFRDSRNGRVYVGRDSPSGMQYWQPGGTNGEGSWSGRFSPGRTPWYAASAFDPVRGQVLIVGSFAGTIAPALYDVSETNTTAPLTAQTPTFTGLGASPLTALSGYPGMVYDPTLDCYWAVYNGATNIEIYKIVPQGGNVFDVTSPSIGGTKPPTRINGVLNAVQYSARLKGMVIATRYNANMHYLRTAP